jgi:hypothetical protein
MQTLSKISPLKNFYKDVLVGHFHFKREMRIKEKYYKKSQSGHCKEKIN